MAVFFASELEGVAIFWRIYRRDGVTLGLTSHDRSLSFGGIVHHAAPGVAPAAIRKTAGLSDESAEVSGALTHDLISPRDLSAGLYDEATIEIGPVNWETLEHSILYTGQIGDVTEGPQEFSAHLRSSKRSLERDLVRYTSPTCRAEFCGPGCSLSSAKFTQQSSIDVVDLDSNSIHGSQLPPAIYISGKVTPLEGPQAGVSFTVVGEKDGGLVLDKPIHSAMQSGTRIRIQEGCDHTHATCHSRFANAINFRGEPFLPGNDLLTRYPKPQ